MKKVIIMGAGPAGLSAGYKLIKNGAEPILFETENQVGGISKTICYKDYHFDLGGHRFFTKAEDVNSLWNEILGEDFRETPRLSRIYYKNKFFNYPLTPVNALFGVGIIDTAAIMVSYLNSKLEPYPKEDTFEEWISNRFGKKLYSMFFKTYTEKVWGIPCSSIQAEWSAQRIKGLSLSKAILNALFKGRSNNVKTLIDKFHYPVYGPGMMYNEMKRKIVERGGTVHLESKVVKVNHRDSNIESIEYKDKDGKIHLQEGSDFLSSIPVTELIGILDPAPGKEILEAADQLTYRSLITVDIIINKKDVFPDNWIYIHSPDVKLGRIQNFKNWSRNMVPDKNKTSLGLEYFCTENDELWNRNDEELFQLAASEVENIKICEASQIEDYIVIRVPKAYPVYSTGYKEHISIIEEYVKRFSNLQLIGRYGLFKYNNMDHSILTGLYAANNIIQEHNALDTWTVNTEDEYQEEQNANEIADKKWRPSVE